MVYQNEIVINKIKTASNPEDVKMIIDKIVMRLAKKNSQGKIPRNFIDSILLVLEFNKSREMDPLVIQNLKLAIALV